MIPNRSSNNYNFFQRVPKDFIVEILIFPYVLNLFNKVEITLYRLRAVFRNSIPNLLEKCTIHEQMINVFNIIVTEETITININSNIS